MISATFQDIPEAYRESSFYTLDNYVLPKKAEIHPDINQVANDFAPVEEEHTQTNSEETSGPFHLPEIPLKKFPKKNKASACRELLQEIKSLTFITSDLESLESLEEGLLDLRDMLLASCPIDSGLVIEEPKAQKRFRERELSKLPVPKKKAVNHNRVGVKAEETRKASVRKLDDCFPIQNTKGNIECEEVNITVDAVYDIPPMSTETPDNDVPIITAVLENNVMPRKRRRMLLSKEEKTLIVEKDMLSDESINIAMNLLNDQFGAHIAGLMDTVLGKTNGFEIVPRTKPFVQILHTGAQHWICVANMSKDRIHNNKVEVYDSLSSGTVNANVMSQISSFCYTTEKSICLDVKSVQQQENGVDCGPFAIAFATGLIMNEDPTEVTYDERKLREHLLKCLTEGKMSPFPKKTSNAGKVIRCKNKKVYPTLLQLSNAFSKRTVNGGMLFLF